MVGLFDRAGLNINFGKKVGMVCHLFQVARNKLEAAYRRKMTGEGPLYWERQQGWIQCKEGEEEMVLRSLAGLMQTQHGRASEGRRCWEAVAPGEELWKYRMAILTARGPRNCPVEGCPGQAAMKTAM